MTTRMVWAAPILPGKVEAWRRFCQEMQGSRLAQFGESRQHLGVTREETWLLRIGETDIAIVCLHAENPEHLLPRLACSDHPFDRWFKRQLLETYGLDLEGIAPRPTMELVLQWPGGRKCDP